jgi:acyl-coenzyme A thioesterase PaaI-like protein
LTVRAEVIKFGRTLCPVSVDLFDENDTLVAVAQVSYIRVDALGG